MRTNSIFITNYIFIIITNEVAGMDGISQETTVRNWYFPRRIEEKIHKELHSKANDEKEFLGWLELPTNYDKDEFERIKNI